MKELKARNKKQKLNRRYEIKKTILLYFLSICLVISLSIGIGGFFSNAQTLNEDITYKYYKSVLIYPGDTLSAIAINYSAKEDITSYIKEVKRMNSLKDDNIKAGNYLIVPYYSQEFSEK